MAKRSRRNASRGSVNNIILETLYSGSKYGYEIIKEVEEKTDGKIVLKQPSLYSSLTRFENKGYVTSSWADSEIGGRRHYYTLTDEGKAYYENCVLNKRSCYEFLNDDYEFDNSIPTFEESESFDTEDNSDNDNSYDYDVSSGDESISYTGYNFDVNDRITSLLSDDDEEIEDAFSDPNDDEENIEAENDVFFDNESESEDVDDIQYDEPTLHEEDLDVDNSEENSIDEEDLYQSINSIHANYTEDKEYDNNDTLKYTNNLSKEINDVYNSIKATTIENNTPIDEESPYEREKKKQESMNILYGNNVISRQEESEHTYSFAEAPPTYFVDENGITKKYINTNSIQQTSYSNPNQANMFNSSDFDEIMRKGNKTKSQRREQTSTPIIDQFDQLSDEEIERRNKIFQEKFDNIADSRMVKPAINNEQDIDKSAYIEEEYVDTQNNFVSFDEDDNDSYYFKYNDKEIEENDPTNNVKISEYNNYQKNENDDFAEINQRNYIKSNKAKFVLGLTLLVVMLIEFTSLLFILKTKTTLGAADNTLFIIGYVLIIVISLSLMVPMFFNPNKRKLNTFKFGYSLTLGILSFLVLCTLTYAVNAFLGFDITNIEFFYAKLLIPITLSFNLILGPIIYKIISINKKMY